MAIGYRSIMSIEDSQDAVKIASSQARSWLRKKFPDSFSESWVEVGLHRISERATLAVVQVADERDQSVRQLIKLTENNNAGTWVVRITSSSLPNARGLKQSVMVELDKVDASVEEAVIDAKPPAVVKLLLEACRISDHETELSPTPTLVRGGESAEVIRAILDPHRGCHVVVGLSPGGVPDQSWTDAILGLTKDSIGVTSSFAVSTDAVEELLAELPSTHSIPRGGVRTFAPRVDFEDPSDSVRHRVLTPATFARSIRNGRVGGYLPSVHAETARRSLVEAELPTEIRRSTELLWRDEARLMRTAAAQQRRAERKSTPLETDVSLQALPEKIGKQLYSTLTKLFKKWLPSSELSPENVQRLDEAIEQTRDEYQVATDQIEHFLLERRAVGIELEQLRKDRDEAELAAALEADEAREVKYQVRTLEYRLRELDRADQTIIGPEDPAFDAPSNIQELIDRITEGSDSPIYKYIRFTGSASDALEIDKRDALGRIAGKLWDYTMVLFDYAESRMNEQFSGSVHAYLTEGPADGRKCSSQRHAARESTTTMSNPKLVRERTFPVPARVNADQEVPMMAHFRPTHSDTFAPRMHYYDDVEGSGMIYIGYIGRHLSNSKTN